MKCEIIQDLLSSYVDQTCNKETKEIVEEHLNSCKECKQLYEEICRESHEIPTIQEGKVFKKVKKDFYKKLIMAILFIFIFLLGIGTELSCMFVKTKINLYMLLHPEYLPYDFEMISFDYHDYGVSSDHQGSSYVAKYKGNNIDELIVVTTDGFWLTISDSFDYHIKQKHRTAERLWKAYESDIISVLVTENPEIIEVYGHEMLYDNVTAYLEKECNYSPNVGHSNDNYDYLTLNMNYKRSLDNELPFRVDINLKVTNEQYESEEIVKKIVQILKDKGFNTHKLNISLYNKDKNQNKTIPTIYNLDY